MCLTEKYEIYNADTVSTKLSFIVHGYIKGFQPRKTGR